MIHTDGIQTIANARPTASQRIRQARALRDAALARGHGVPGQIHDNASFDLDRMLHPDERRGPASNGIDWNDDFCVCGMPVADSPAGDKCWDCFNFDPSE